MDAGLGYSWILAPDVVDGRRFVDIYTRDYRCQKYFDGNYVMVNHIKKIRDAKAAEAMRGLSHSEEDPTDLNNIRPEGTLNRPRRELIDRIPRVLEITVVTRNGVEATVNVLPSWREKGVLQIELTKENMDLLLEDPPAASAPFTPKISQTDVVWLSHRNHVRCTYWESKKRHGKSDRSWSSSTQTWMMTESKK